MPVCRDLVWERTDRFEQTPNRTLHGLTSRNFFACDDGYNPPPSPRNRAHVTWISVKHGRFAQFRGAISGNERNVFRGARSHTARARESLRPRGRAAACARRFSLL